MKRLLRFIFMMTAMLAVAVPAQSFRAERDWDPGHTWVFATGVLKWKNSELSGFSTKNRRDAQLVQEFRNQGVPEDHIVYLSDSQATLKSVMRELDAVLTKVPKEDTLVFYYCGHGWLDDNGQGYLANYDAGESNDQCWSVNEITGHIARNFHGSKLIMLADCCRSGCLADGLRQHPSLPPWMVLTSAIASQDSTSNWTFTESVLDTLRGHRYADLNADGVITAGELGSYVKQEMSQLENQNATVAFSSDMPRQFVFAKVADPGEPVPANVEVRYDGQWWKAKQIARKDDQAHIRWVTIGWDSADDATWVPVADVRPIKSVNSLQAAADRPSSGDNVSSVHSVGDHIQVLWEGKYYPAVVRKMNGGNYFIHYDGYENNWDEWVGASRIK